LTPQLGPAEPSPSKPGRFKSTSTIGPTPGAGRLVVVGPASPVPGASRVKLPSLAAPLRQSNGGALRSPPGLRAPRAAPAPRPHRPGHGEAGHDRRHSPGHSSSTTPDDNFTAGRDTARSRSTADPFSQDRWDQWRSKIHNGDIGTAKEARPSRCRDARPSDYVGRP
jgi:hypothetical protein